MTTDNAGESTSRKQLGPAMALVAAALLAIGSLTSAWWQSEGDQQQTYQVGLFRAEICRGDDCTSRTLAGLGIDATWSKMGGAALGGALTSGMLLLIMAMSFGRKDWRRHLGWVTAVMVLFTASLVVMAHLRKPFDEVSPGWGLFVGFLGLGLALMASGLRLVAARPPAE